jgi:hypothetical protein
MALVVAIKNRTSIVVATDAPEGAADSRYGQLMPLLNRSVLLVAGNLQAAKHTVLQTFLPRITREESAAAAAQILHAALIVEMVPHLSILKGRVEFVVAGIDPVRHTEVPSLYYMDSAQGFNLGLVQGDAVAAGSTAAITPLFSGHSYGDASIEQLKLLAKECLSSTKLRWPQALGTHARIAIVTPHRTQLMEF